jgi:hypothetical protein
MSVFRTRRVVGGWRVERWNGERWEKIAVARLGQIPRRKRGR